MKIKIILFGLFFSFQFAAHAQYQPTALKGRQWSEFIIGQFGPNIMKYYRIADDTLYNGEMLPKLIEEDKQGNYLHTIVAIKEDTVAPSITFYTVDRSGSFNALYGDSLYLDLSLSIGDSAAYACTNTDTSYYVLDSIGVFVDALSHNRKQYFFHVNSSRGASPGFNWVEGLGSIGYGGIISFMPITCVTDVPFPQLLCVNDSTGVQLYQNPNFDSCSVPIGLDEFDYINVAFYPNPANTNVNLPENLAKDIVAFRFITIDGQEVKNILWNGETRISVENLPEGVYQMVMELKGGKSATGTLTIMR